MRTVITYGTFDLFHEGHRRILERAKNLGDYLIVGVTSEVYDSQRGKLNVQQDLVERIENVKKSGLADKIIVESHEGQKIEDIQKYDVDVFAIGSDWLNKFDYLKEYCEVVYLERTKGVSSTEVRNKKNGLLKIGVVGYGRIANRFIPESKFVSGVEVVGVYGRNNERALSFKHKHELLFSSTDYNEFLAQVDAVYIATPHETHYDFAKKAILSNKHVLVEKPIALARHEIEELFNLAKQRDLVVFEGIKTAYAPGFVRMISLIKSGVIGEVKNVEASFTKLEDKNNRELQDEIYGGSVLELASYPLLAIIKILGEKIEEIQFKNVWDETGNIDIFSKIELTYKDAFASAKVGLGVKSEGDLVVAGTKGYIYVPAPWWKTSYFEFRAESINDNKKYYYPFEGDGLRYEIAEFLRIVNSKDRSKNVFLGEEESIALINIIEKFLLEKKLKV